MEKTMLRLGKYVLASLLAAVPATALAASGSGTLPGAWHQLRPAQFAVPQAAASVWTGKQLVVFGRTPATNPSRDVAEAYDPARNAWTRLTPPAGPPEPAGYQAVWTGKEMLVFGSSHSVAFNPAKRQWRVLHGALPGGMTVWTGHEAIGWGGGCCGDAQSKGAAYNPKTDAFRKLARSPLAPSQTPLGVWTGREVVLLVSAFGPDGKPWPARLARVAAYDPTTNAWRRLAALPQTGTRFAATAIWDGHEVLVAGAGDKARSTFAYNPTTNSWRRLASLPAPRFGAVALWTGKRMLLWGGQNTTAPVGLRDGVAYDPNTNRWTSIPAAPLRARSGSTVAWTGHALIVWGGEIGTPPGTSKPPTFPRDGASFEPARP
jgi:N-acetylneuraminic acid mutarotase